jgi:hypothetical protein
MATAAEVEGGAPDRGEPRDGGRARHARGTGARGEVRQRYAVTPDGQIRVGYACWAIRYAGLEI